MYCTEKYSTNSTGTVQNMGFWNSGFRTIHMIRNRTIESQTGIR